MNRLCLLLVPGLLCGLSATAAPAEHLLRCGQTLTVAVADAPVRVIAPADSGVGLERVKVIELGIDVVLSVQTGAWRQTLDGFPSKLTEERWVAVAPGDTTIAVRPRFRRQSPGQVRFRRDCGVTVQPLTEWWLDAMQGRASQALADLEYDRAGTPEPALQAWSRAAAWLRASGPLAPERRAWLHQAEAYARLMAGDREAAFAELEAAQQSWTVAGRWREAAVAAYSLATTAHQLARREDSFAAASRAQQLAERAGDTYWATMARQHLCVLQRQDGDAKGAQDCYAQVLKRFLALRDFQAAALVAHGQAVVQRMAGNLPLARELAEQARAWSDPTSRNHVRALALLGRLALDQARIAPAVAALSDAAEIAAAHGFLEDQANADLDLVRVYLQLGNLARARHILTLVPPRPQLSWRTLARLDLLDTQLDLADSTTEVAARLHALADRYAERKRSDHAQSTRLLAAAAELDSGASDAAATTLARFDGQPLSQRQQESRALLQLELDAVRAGPTSAWLAVVAAQPTPRDPAIARKRDLRLAQWSLKAGTPTDRERALALAGQWLDRLAHAIGASGSPAVQVALRRQAEPFLAVLARQQLEGPAGVTDAAILTVWTAVEQLRSASAPERVDAAGMDPKVLEPASRWIAKQLLGDDGDTDAPQLKDEEDLLRALDSRQRSAAIEVEAQVLERSLQRVPQGVRIIEWIAGDTQSWLLVADGAGLHIRALPGGAALQVLIDEAYAWASGRRATCSGCSQLSQLLGLSHVPEQLVVVGSGPLARLPWAALPVDRGGSPLLERTAVSLARRLGSGQPLAPDSASAHALIVLAATRGGRWQDGAAALPGLPGARAEAYALGAQLGARLTLKLDSEATPTALRQALATPAADVLLAAHGFSDPRRWFRAGLLLDSPTGAVPLTLPQLLDWPVRARRVVLSACSTVPELATAEEAVQSLGATLLASGAREVVGSQWEISDRAAVALTRAFHERSDQAAAAALRHAQSQLRLTRAFRAPRYWAGLRVLRSTALEDWPGSATITEPSQQLQIAR